MKNTRPVGLSVRKKATDLLGNNVHVVDIKHPYRGIETRSTFVLVACLLTPNPSSRILLQATPNRAWEGERDVATASTLLLALENCTRSRGGGGMSGKCGSKFSLVFFRVHVGERGMGDRYSCSGRRGAYTYTSAYQLRGNYSYCAAGSTLSTFPYYHLTRGDYQLPGNKCGSMLILD